MHFVLPFQLERQTHVSRDTDVKLYSRISTLVAFACITLSQPVAYIPPFPFNSAIPLGSSLSRPTTPAFFSYLPPLNFSASPRSRLRFQKKSDRQYLELWRYRSFPKPKNIYLNRGKNAVLSVLQFQLGS